LFSDELSLDLRRDLARRMAEFPRTIESRPLLRFAVKRLSAGLPRDRLLYRAAQPFGWAWNAVVRFQDHIETACYIAEHLRRLKAPPRRETPIAWSRLVAEADDRTEPFRPRRVDRGAGDREPRLFSNDADFNSAV